jgi:hypothetical protein
MSRRTPKTTQAFVKSMLRGAAEASIDINKVRVEIASDGKIILVPSSTIFAHDDLDQELAKFEARHGKS